MKIFHDKGQRIMPSYPFEAETKGGDVATVVAKHGNSLIGFVTSGEKRQPYFWNHNGRVLARNGNPAGQALQKNALRLDGNIYDALYEPAPDKLTEFARKVRTLAEQYAL